MADVTHEVDIGSPTGPVYADLILDDTAGTVSGDLFANVPGLGKVNFGHVNGTIKSGKVSIVEEVAGSGVDLSFAEGDANATVTLKVLGNSVYSLSVPIFPVCYRSGTAIRVEHGETLVENLSIGDNVVTKSGALRPVRWIGRRDYAGRFANANPDLLPVCIKANAIDDGVPSRDLWVSPRHALFLDGVLIPAALLVNGKNVVKAERVDELTYWHIELDSHDVILAENTPAESFVDDNGRGMFHNAASYHALYPDAAFTEAVYCAPRVESGHALHGVRRRVDARAGLPTPSTEYGTLQGRIEICDGSSITGWARDDLYPDAPVCLDVLVDGELVALLYADQARPDLRRVDIAAESHGFTLELPLASAVDHTVEVRRAADGARLAGSPLLVPARVERAA